MKLFFRKKKMCKVCSSDSEMNKKYGPDKTKKLQQRLGELRAAANLLDVCSIRGARCHQLSGDRKGQFSVDLVHPDRLLFIVANKPIPLDANGGIDYGKVTEIEILESKDTHE